MLRERTDAQTSVEVDLERIAPMGLEIERKSKLALPRESDTAPSFPRWVTRMGIEKVFSRVVKVESGTRIRRRFAEFQSGGRKPQRVEDIRVCFAIGAAPQLRIQVPAKNTKPNKRQCAKVRVEGALSLPRRHRAGRPGRLDRL